MLEIQPKFDASNEIQIGKICEFTLVGFIPGIESRVFLIHQNIHYLKPISDWSSLQEIRLFPEAPGNYLLLVQWRYLHKGTSGWLRQSFEISVNLKDHSSPHQITMKDDIRLWAPSKWEAVQLQGYERAMSDFLPKIIQPGNIIYDIGANIGQYSVPFSRMVGQKGHVYCIEANPVCIYFLQVNLQLNQITNCEILPISLSNSHGLTEFTVNYGNSALGISHDSAFFEYKVGHKIGIQSLNLDDLIENYNLQEPDLLKIDVEGAEEFAVKGMEKTLTSSHPDILIELHGQRAAYQTLTVLDKFHYRYNDLISGKSFLSASDLLISFPDKVLQFYCSATAK